MTLLNNKLSGQNAETRTGGNSVTIIEPASGWKLVDFKELREYRDLFYFLVWREIKVLYAQTILGLSWAILQPLIQIAIFSIVFGKVAKVPTDGTPYILFTTISIIPWTYMSQAMTQSSQSLLQGHAMLDKIYFPRLLFPITPVLARLVDFSISMVIIFIVMAYYLVHPTWNLLFLPLFLCMMIIIPTGIGMWLSALSIRFRDVKHAMPFVVRMLIYSAPIVYSASSIPEKYRIIYSFNPIVGVIEGFRACLLGTPMPWQYIWPGVLTSLLLLLTGAFYFKRMERIFVDVI
ncbi:MAG: ABC transporter permease [Desulfobacteraceae bacterium]|nr:MAG: ABC transporter permease [Desulfobacteraceae bacterium]